MRPTGTRRRSGRRRVARAIGAVIAASLLATACAGSSDSADEPAAEERGGFDAVDAGGSAADGVATEAGDRAGRDGEQAAEDGGEAGGDGEVLRVGAPLGRKVIFTARLALQADDTTAAVEDIRRVVERVGGFVAAADLHRTDDDHVAGTLTLRVPTGQLDSTLAAVRQVADRVTDESIDSDDVTEEHSDLEAQLRNLRALEVELLSLLAEVREKSDSAEQVLAVFERIRQVRGEIERLEGRRQVLDDLVALATIEVALEPTPAAAPLAADEWRPGDVARAALRSTVGALRVVADVAIWLALTALPVLLVVLGVPLAVAYGLRRRRSRSAELA